MSDTDIYRVMYMHNSRPNEWRHFISRSNGEGFYTRFTAAQNAIKQIEKWTSDTRIQKLCANTDQWLPSDPELIWVDVSE